MLVSFSDLVALWVVVILSQIETIDSACCFQNYHVGQRSCSRVATALDDEVYPSTGQKVGWNKGITSNVMKSQQDE